LGRKTSTATSQVSKEIYGAARVTPTIVLVCGTIGEREVTALREQVFHRLDSQIPSEFVGWAQISQAMAGEPAILKQTIADVVCPFLELRYIKNLWERSFVEDDARRRFLESIPDGEEPFRPQVIILYWALGDDIGVATSFLQSIETALKDVFSHRADPALTLIAVGDSLPELLKGTSYWPRFRLRTRTESGFETDVEWLLENCANLILALIASELRFDIQEWFTHKSVRWLGVGASAVAVNVRTMREFVEQSVVRDLTGTVLSQPETTETIQLTQPDITTRIEQLQADMLATGLSSVNTQGWNFEALPQTRIVANAAFHMGGGLKPQMLKPDNDPTGIVVQEFQTGTLFKYYKDLRDALRKQISVAAGKTFVELLRYLRSLLQVPVEPSTQSTPVTDILSSGVSQEITEDVIPDEFTAEEQHPRGLKVVTAAVKQAKNCLHRSADFERAGVYRHQIGTDDYLRVVGELDEEMLKLADLRYKRFRRTALSPLGFVLKLFPAWPLLTMLLFMFLRWDEWLAAAVAGILLTALGVVEYLVIENAMTKLRQMLVNEIEQKVAGSVFGILAKVLRDYRLQMVVRLREISHTLNDLYATLVNEHANSSEQAARWARYLTELDRHRSTVHWLNDLEQCQTWINTAVAKSRVRGLELMRLVDTEILARKQPASHRNVFDRLMHQARILMNETFEESRLVPFDLPNRGQPIQQNEMPESDIVEFRYPLLKQAKMWEWLYQVAQPLGGYGGTHLNIIGIEHPAAIQGALGEGSEYFKRRTPITTLSRQKHEIICIRISVEPA
jgi:hypothetical protein